MLNNIVYAFVQRYGVKDNQQFILYSDSKSEIGIAYNPVLRKRRRMSILIIISFETYRDIDIFMVFSFKLTCKKDIIKTVFLDSIRLYDALTKALGKTQFKVSCMQDTSIQ